MARALISAIAGIVIMITPAGPSFAAPRDQFYWMTEINKASAVMLVERGIVPKPLGARIADAIIGVDAAGQKPDAVRSRDYLTPAAAGRTSPRPRSA